MKKKQLTARALLCVLDFDGVLFDDGKFKEAHQRAFKRYGVSPRLYEDIYHEAKRLTGGHYAPPIHYALISRRVPLLSRALLHKKSATLVRQSRQYLYADVKPFLQWCDESDVVLALVSTGHSFQKKKISASGLAPFFKKTVVTKDISKVAGIRAVMGKVGHRRVVFVDDKHKVLDEVKRELPEVFTVRMERHKREADERVDESVRNFAGVKKIIHAIKTKSAL
ncbi:MAG: HAD hydrolase-like protein [bacterium]|nr:HAD hydrolase-like protein [bacterium]MDZ4299958.1 HAD hydrolase-like protein [Candidatus Sungbacteria bacterium]